MRYSRLVLFALLAIFAGATPAAASWKKTPDTTITAGPTAGSTTTSTTATFSFSSNQAYSTFSCSLDSAAFTACTSPKSLSGLGVGSHTFRVRATSSGRTDQTPATRTWTVTSPSLSPAPAPTPTPTPTPEPRTTWAPVGSLPLADATAAARVTRVAENRAQNAGANTYVPTDAELTAFQNAKDQYGQTNLQITPLAKYVTGRSGLSNPSTDDLIQWAAHKWGIPEDWIRAQMTVESWWNQSALGDRTTVGPEWYVLYPAQARIEGTSDVMQSMGVMQVRWSHDGSVGAGTEPLRWKSVAFNVDYYASIIRYYYDGYCRWCTAGYTAGQAWESIGAWYSPYPWNNAGAQNYTTRVQTNLANRTWAQTGF